MTKKQFTVTNISKNGMKGLFKLGNDTLSIYDVARLINELLEENEQIMKENKELKNKLHFVMKRLNEKDRLLAKVLEVNKNLEKK